MRVFRDGPIMWEASVRCDACGETILVASNAPITEPYRCTRCLEEKRPGPKDELERRRALKRRQGSLF